MWNETDVFNLTVMGFLGIIAGILIVKFLVPHEECITQQTFLGPITTCSTVNASPPNSVEGEASDK